MLKECYYNSCSLYLFTARCTDTIYTRVSYRMASQEGNTPGNNLLANNIESPPFQLVNQNSLAETSQRSKEAISARS